MKVGKYYVHAIPDNGIERESKDGKQEICNGYYCIVYEDEDCKVQVDDFCLAVGYEITDVTEESLEKGVYWYLGVERTEKQEEQRMVKREALTEAEKDKITENAYYQAVSEELQAEQTAKEERAMRAINERRELELKAKLYDVVKSYYGTFDDLAKRLQDDYAGTTPFVQQEEDRLGLCFTLDYMDDLEEEIQKLQNKSEQITDERKTELLGNFVGWFIYHHPTDKGLFHDLHVEMGMTKEEMHEFGVEGIDEYFYLAEKEKQEINEENGEITGAEFIDEIRLMTGDEEDDVVMDWLEFIGSVSESTEGNFNKELGDTLRALYYVKNEYGDEVLQQSLKCQILSNEIVKGAMYFNAGYTQEQVEDLAKQGFLMDGHVPSVHYGRNGEENDEQDETTKMITAEDVTKNVVYALNAPDCCAEEHAENMLGMLGANIVDTEIFHDEKDCPKREKVDYKQAVKDSVGKEFAEFKQEYVGGASIQQVLDGSEKYVAMKTFVTTIEDVEFDDEIYVALYQDKGKILKNLYGDYSCNDEVNVRNRGDCAEFIESSARTNHGLVIDEYLEMQEKKDMGMGGIQ